MDSEGAVGALVLGMAEAVGFYVAAVIGGGAVTVIGFILYGRGGKKRFAEQSQKIAELKTRLKQAPVQVNINVEKSMANGAQEPEGTPPALPPQQGAIFHAAEFLPIDPDYPDSKRVRVGTVRGPMTLRLNHEKTLDDVLRILGKHNVLASLSDEYEGRDG